MDDGVSTDEATRLVAQVIWSRTEGLDGPRVAAFLSGWESAIELIGYLAERSSQPAKALIAMVGEAQQRAFADG